MKCEDAENKSPKNRTLAENIAVSVIYGGKENSGLHDRSGFDHFWDNIDEDIHDEMWDEIIGNIEEALSKHLKDEL